MKFILEGDAVTIKRLDVYFITGPLGKRCTSQADTPHLKLSVLEFPLLSICGRPILEY